jgi:hypothetical protein
MSPDEVCLVMSFYCKFYEFVNGYAVTGRRFGEDLGRSGKRYLSIE